MSTVKIFSIATNNYSVFLERFVQSFQTYFLPEAKREFYIFTDNIETNKRLNANIKYYEITHEKWPFVTLNRYKYINNLKSSITDDDLCLFADIDLEAISTIENFDIDKLFAVNHPGNFYVDNINSLEDNRLSLAYVDRSQLPNGYKYIQGCLWGGKGDHFLNLISTLNNNTLLDYQNGIIAKWHDESHLNKYLVENFDKFKILSSSFAYPQNWNLDIPKFIIHKDKNMKEYPRHAGI